MALLVIMMVGLLAGTISGIVGTGSSIILLPILAYSYGPKEAVPIMAVAAVMANLSRILVWWRQVDWRAVAAYAATGVPAAFLGARTMLALPPELVDGAIGLFLILMIPGRRWLASKLIALQIPHLAIAGLGIGFLTGIVASTGPISVPIFLGYGLVGGAFIGTEAAASLLIYAAKTMTFQGSGALPLLAILKGLTVGASLMLGAFVSKPFVLRLTPTAFRHIMDTMLALSGLSLLWAAAS